MIGKLRILPRWIIFLLDLGLVAFCIALSLYLRYNFSALHILNPVYIGGFRFIIAGAMLLNAVLFYIFKSYTGIIRYTTLEDTSRLIIINLVASLFYFTINSILKSVSGVDYFPNSAVAINFFIISFAIVSYRLIVRFAFKYYRLHQQVETNKIKAAIYSASDSGIHIKKVMNDLPNGDILVVAFIDDVLNKSGKLMEGIPIYGTDEGNLEKLRADGVELLIIAEHNIKAEKLNYLVDVCLKYNIRVQRVPPIQAWLNGKLNTQQLQNINIEDLLGREVIKIDNQKIHFELKGKKILVTGAAGSIGSELVRQLVNFKPSIIILCDKAESPLHELMLEINEKFKSVNIKGYIGDICDVVRMEHLFEIYNPQVVFHAAAYKHVPLMEDNPSVAILNNVLGTKILAELSVLNKVEKFVMISTDKAVNPTNIMGASKRIAEIFTQSYYRELIKDYETLINRNEEYPTKFVTTRFGNVLGSNGSVIPRFKNQLQHGGPITVTHPEITRYFMTIPEACQLVIEAGVMGQGGEIFVFDMGEPVKIVDLAKKIIRLSGKVPEVDIKIVFTGLRPGEKLYEELLNNSENTMPTYHDKIMIAKVREYNFQYISDRINKLIESARRHYTLETVGQMKQIVPEFISNNSVYESLDVKTKV